jgi:alkylation response protein AidB-like acyl-CoA dehydrogenase
MDFRMNESFRAEVKSFLDEHMTDEIREQIYRTGVSHHDGFNAAMHERGWLLAGWPEELGGPGLDAMDHIVLMEELLKAEAPTIVNGVTLMVAHAIERFGTDEQKRDILPKALHGEVKMALGFSEPGSGSDVASAQTRAVRDGDDWIVNGSKMFTTNGHIADYIFLLARTNPDVAKHKGLTMFLLPTDQPGFEAQGVFTMSGERTNITYYTDARVPDSLRIGDVDGGWKVITSSLQDEHSGGFGASLALLLESAEEWARTTTDEDGRARIEDPDVRERLGRCATEVEVSLLLQRRATWMSDNGQVPVAEGPMSKLFSSEAMERASQDLTEMVGPDGLRSYFEPTAPAKGRIEHSRRYAIGTTIYAGASEVQRNIIAQRGLGLPR